jgi:hypothetical protein
VNLKKARGKCVGSARQNHAILIRRQKVYDRVSEIISSSLSLVQQNTVLTGEQKLSIGQYLNQRGEEASSQSLDDYLQNQPPQVAEEVNNINAASQRKALRSVILSLAILAAIGLLGTIGLPKRKIPEANSSP